MSGAWYALATIAIALVIRWYLKNDTGPSAPKAKTARNLKGNSPERPE